MKQTQWIPIGAEGDTLVDRTLREDLLRTMMDAASTLGIPPSSVMPTSSELATIKKEQVKTTPKEV